MAKKKKLKIKPKYIYIAVIAAFSLMSGKVFITDMVETAQDVNIQEDIEKSPAGKVMTDFETLGKSGGQAAQEIPAIGDADWTSNKSSTKKNNKTDADIDLSKRIEGSIVRVVDGDTYVIKIKDEDYKVRLIGVDTPESVAPSTYSKNNTEEGKTVSDIVKSTLQEGDTVYCEFDVNPQDKYNRYLCYVYFADGTTMIQDWLLSNGYAQVMTVQPNSKYADHFVEIQRTAAENKVGLWNGFFEED